MQETSTIEILLCIKDKNINIHNCNLDKKSLMIAVFASIFNPDKVRLIFC